MCAMSNPARDPAPSRWAYRAQRLWLTPAVRSAVLRGLPLAIALSVPLIWLADADRRLILKEEAESLWRQIETRPEFMVRLLAIEGASPAVDAEIREMLPLDFPMSSFDLDLKALRDMVADLDVVKTAELHVRPGGILELKLVERVPAVVWRDGTGLFLLDETGRRVAAVTTRATRADLPLIAGQGADRKVDEALGLIAATGPLQGRIRGLVRQGERRWDVVLDRDQRILLPEDRPVAALERVIALDKLSDMLARDISVVDMRNPARPTVRLAPDAVEDLRRIRRLQSGARDG
ncbi:Cell division protein FtsQ [Rhodovulum sp. P5]|uniref:cell division protein FtsQ/DivIB n=1 Tax=Rhodovulum sp. P5 TaxID=1564506 RepID=UPI0009C39E43|nr:cell division protein FtsQ/DivIB [Rhodovulum sp. P5]ARE40032.1 Cell division protein FtsQ [Rhodovulum sp. P5]